jgi:hypothetical protein
MKKEIREEFSNIKQDQPSNFIRIALAQNSLSQVYNNHPQRIGRENPNSLHQ